MPRRAPTAILLMALVAVPGCLSPLDALGNGAAAVVPVTGGEVDLRDTSFEVTIPFGSDAVAVPITIGSDHWEPSRNTDGRTVYMGVMKCEMTGAALHASAAIEAFSVRDGRLAPQWSAAVAFADRFTIRTLFVADSPDDLDMILVVGTEGFVTTPVVRCGLARDMMSDVPHASRSIPPLATGTGTRGSWFMESDGETTLSRGVLVEDSRTKFGAAAVNGELRIAASHAVDTPAINRAFARMDAAAGRAEATFGYQYDGVDGAPHEGARIATPAGGEGLRAATSIGPIRSHAITTARFAADATMDSLVTFASITLPIDTGAMGYALDITSWASDTHMTSIVQGARPSDVGEPGRDITFEGPPGSLAVLWTRSRS